MICILVLGEMALKVHLGCISSAVAGIPSSQVHKAHSVTRGPRCGDAVFATMRRGAVRARAGKNAHEKKGRESQARDKAHYKTAVEKAHEDQQRAGLGARRPLLFFKWFRPFARTAPGRRSVDARSTKKS